MRNFISDRARIIPPSGIRKFFDLVLSMDDVISLGVGEPDYVTPWKICEAGIYAIEQGFTSYTSNKGIESLRISLSRYLQTEYNLMYESDSQMIITAGVSEALDIAIRAVINPGDEVLVTDPIYVSYPPCVTLSGGKAIPVPCDEKNQFKLLSETLIEKVTPKTKALIMNFPNNPSGAVMEKSDLKGIADIVTDHDLLLISDEVYSDLTYSGKHVPAATIGDLWERTITLNGFSKSYAMTGWRIGYLCAPDEICEAALKIHQYVMLCAPIMGQMAANEALKSGNEDKEEMVREYRMRRNLFVEGLNRIGLPCHVPEGAFYAFPSVKETGLSDTDFAEQLLKESRVAVVPGSVFGEKGKDHIRCAYAVSREDLAESLRRIESFIEGLK